MRSLHLSEEHEHQAHAGIKELLESDGWLGMEGDALFIAPTQEALHYWLDLEQRHVVKDTVELETRQVPDSVVATETSIETVATQTEEDASATDTDDAATESGGSEEGGPELGNDREPATRVDVISRIRNRATSRSKTTGRRALRQRNPIGRTLT